MSIDERRRHALHERRADVLEPEHATTLMELLPPVGWTDVAGKQDVAMLHGDIRALEDRVDSKLARLELGITKELAALRSDLEREVGACRTDLGREMSALRTEVHAALRHQTWAILGVLLVAILINQTVSHVL